jgi:hypothetical protein
MPQLIANIVTVRAKTKTAKPIDSFAGENDRMPIPAHHNHEFRRVAGPKPRRSP